MTTNTTSQNNTHTFGTTTVELELSSWENNGRENFQVDILCAEHPYTGYFGIRGLEPTLDDVREEVDSLIADGNRDGMKGYTEQQLIELHSAICKIAPWSKPFKAW